MVVAVVPVVVVVTMVRGGSKIEEALNNTKLVVGKGLKKAFHVLGLCLYTKRPFFSPRHLLLLFPAVIAGYF